MTNEQDMARAREQAQAQFNSIREMVEALKRAREIEEGEFDWEAEAERLDGACVQTGDDETKWQRAEEPDAPMYDEAEEFCRAVAPDDYPSEDNARQRIDEDALSVEVRSGWHTPGGDGGEAEEYRILLCTGGPACQIRGTLDRNEPETAEIQYQDWFTPWTDWRGEDVPDDCEEILLEYARCFWFGE